MKRKAQFDIDEHYIKTVKCLDREKFLNHLMKQNKTKKPLKLKKLHHLPKNLKVKDCSRIFSLEVTCLLLNLTNLSLILTNPLFLDLSTPIHVIY